MTKQKINNGNYAAIDIGSNAVRLLIKRISLSKDGLSSTKEQLFRVPLRLGADVFTKNKISKQKVKGLTMLMQSFANIMELYDVLDYKACATSAIRDAANGKEVISLIKKKTDIKIHILSGKEEAKLIYKTHNDCIQERKGNFLYVDVGGGSTEINLIIDNTLIFSNSYDIGTIRVLSNTVDPEEWVRLKSDLSELVKTYSNINILGTGGNINKLYRLIEKRDKKQQCITVSQLDEIYQHMIHLNLEERVKLYNLKYDRAEVIVPASYVFLMIAKLINAKYIYVPTVGLVDGIIDDLIIKKLNKLGLISKKVKENPCESECILESDTSEDTENELSECSIDIKNLDNNEVDDLEENAENDTLPQRKN